MTYIKHREQIGFTLIELMVVLAIAAILIGIGVPAFNGLRNNNCLVTNTNRLVASLQFARSEAAKRNADVSLRARSASGCINTACGDRSWRLGFEIITDEDLDGDGVCTGLEDFHNLLTNLNATPVGQCDEDAILKVIELSCGNINPARGLQLTHTSVNDAADQLFTYRSSGRINSNAVGGVFQICMADYVGEQRGRETRITSIGRPQTNTVDINSCNPFTKP